MQIFEIFRSIQGETTQAGLPTWFVRLAGCDLACTYCDTAAARDPAAGRAMTVAEVLTAIATPALPHVAITGGEPMHQVEGPAKMGSGASRRRAPDPISAGPSSAVWREVLVETNGAHPIDALDPRAVRIVDCKTPGSGMAARMCWRNLDLVTARDEVKFVLTGRADYDWAKGVLVRHRLAGRTTVLFGAAAPRLDPATLARWILDDGLPVRLNIQLHKMLGMP
jgi:7-carboxy-7-deazaguanine synthase